MEKKYYPWENYERGFLILMVGLAFYGLSNLFSSFIMPMIFAVIVTCASYPLYRLILSKVKNKNLSSGIVVVLMALIVLFPLTYVIGVSSSTVYDLYQNNQDKISEMNFEEVRKLKDDALSYLPLSVEKQSLISSEIDKNATVVFEQAKNIVVKGSKSIIDNSIQVVYFLVLTLFSMFFFYTGGDKIVDKIKKITPLNDDFDDLIMRELYSLCGILTISVFSVAVLQGLAFGLLTYFMDLNWVFIAVAISLTSFIPVIGTFLVWCPLSLYLLSNGQSAEALWVFCWGFFVTGILIDNIVRPLLTGKICKMFTGDSGELDIKDFNPLDNTFMIILSNIGGMLTFGVIGLFLGPIIVSISIAVFDLYIERNKAADEAEKHIDEIKNTNEELKDTPAPEIFGGQVKAED